MTEATPPRRVSRTSERWGRPRAASHPASRAVNHAAPRNETGQSIPGMRLEKSALRALHTPVIYVQGGPTDIAYANGRDDFARIDHVPAVMVDLVGKGHGGTYFEPNGGKAARIVVDWLEWQLRGDVQAAGSFLGDDCRLCGDPEVEIERKNLR